MNSLGIVRDYYEAAAYDGGVSLFVAVAGDEPITADLDRALMLRAVSNPRFFQTLFHIHPKRGSSHPLGLAQQLAEIRIKIS